MRNRLNCVVRIGTSGWYYRHWLGKLYPEDLPLKRMFSYYSKHFNTAEINNSFYALPSLKTVEKWRDESPPEFCFAAKASRYLTHIKRLKDAKEAWQRYIDVMGNLDGKLGPILFQFPQKWGCDLKRVADFLAILPNNYRYVFEFRNTSWYVPEVYGLLKEHRSAFCFYDMNGVETPLELTTDFAYIRMHSPGAKYAGSYSTELLLPWVRRIEDWRDRLRQIYFYFNNDAHGYAVNNALELKSLLQNVIG